MMVSPWSDRGGSLSPPRTKLLFLQWGPVALTDMAVGAKTNEDEEMLPSLLLI